MFFLSFPLWCDFLLKYIYYSQVADELNFQSDKEVYQELFQEEVSQRRRSVRYVFIVDYRKWTSVMHAFLSVDCNSFHCCFDIFVYFFILIQHGQGDQEHVPGDPHHSEF